MAKASRPTLRDVADAAGLSVTQASRALNGHSDVATATRQRAISAARQLGYAPNLEARRLKMPETRAHSLGLVLPGRGVRFSDPFFGELLTWIVHEASANGFELQLSTPPEEEDPTAAYERAIRHQRVDGFILTRLLIDDERVRFLREEQFPFVTFGRVPGTDDVRSVDESDEVMQPAVDLLVSLGHRRIGCVTEPAGHSKATYRLASLRRAAAAHGLEIDDGLVVEAGFHEASGHDSAYRLLANPEPPTAIVALNDLLALGVLRAAAERGLDVPGDLSVVGFDDIEAARLVTPMLTTLRQPTQAVGRHLVHQVLGAIGQVRTEKNEVLLSPELVVRESTAPPRRAA